MTNDSHLITLTTDFGEDSPYVAAMKGVILGIHPEARIIDLSHQIPPQNIRHAAFFLKNAIPYFPTGVIHVVVVDPGVGSGRALFHVAVAGHQLLVPDNGCWTLLIPASGGPLQVRRLTKAEYWRPQVAATFHGRDILAPVAAWLSRGIRPDCLGPLVQEWISLGIPPPELNAQQLKGEVVFVDHFGNLITNIPGAAMVTLAGGKVRVSIGGSETTCLAPTYAAAPPGSLVALVSSEGMLEVAVVQGNAAVQLQAGVGVPVVVTPASAKK